MKKHPSVTLLVSTYNNTDFLQLCLLSVLRQTIKPCEIIIADDGSTRETYETIQQLRKVINIPIIHVWQEDNGFQLAKIRNIAIAASKCEYIIQIDGDIVMHHCFIEDHLRFAQKKTLLQGSRVLLGEKLTKRLIKGNETTVSFFTRNLSRRENTIRWIGLSKFLLSRYRNPYPIYYARGANMSFFKQDFMAVNGYDESFVGWGHEDSDLTLRMLNHGCRKLYVKFSCVAYHLYHKEPLRTNEAMNKERMKENLLKMKVSSTEGISAHLDSIEKYILT
ncbi:MAG: glycosyltransferase family 2 protein [Bacteroidales bacterium]